MRCGSVEEGEVLSWFVEQARALVGARRVVLFGSRARGDAGERSDFDIAIETEHPERMQLLRAVVDENPLTLVAFDIVDLTAVSQEFRNRILSEGRDIL
ncbi:MAG: hypothetical protein RL189_2186 [Pseudomonadota bacterium]